MKMSKAKFFKKIKWGNPVNYLKVDGETKNGGICVKGVENMWRVSKFRWDNGVLYRYRINVFLTSDLVLKSYKKIKFLNKYTLPILFFIVNIVFQPIRLFLFLPYKYLSQGYHFFSNIRYGYGGVAFFSILTIVGLIVFSLLFFLK